MELLKVPKGQQKQQESYLVSTSQHIMSTQRKPNNIPGLPT